MSDLTPHAVQACHDLIVWIVPKLDHFPRGRRYTLGSQIENLMLELLERLMAAAYAKPADKARHLEAANLKLDVLRHLWRLALELRVVNVRAHRFGAEMMVSLGNQIGGWKKSSPARTP